MSSSQPLLKELDRWQEYMEQKEFPEVREYIEKEENVFMVYADNLESSVKSKILKSELGKEARELVMT